VKDGHVRSESLISVVAPLEGDGGSAIAAFVDETIDVIRGLATHYEIILVDDGTTDDSVPQVRELLARYDFVRLLRLSRRFGEETAIAAGLDVAIGDYVIVMLPNMDPPSLIPRFLEAARADADVVYGVRTHRKNEPVWYRAGARAFYWYMNDVIKAGMPEDSTQFRCMSRQVVNAITQIRDPDRYLRVLTSYVGFRKQALPYAPINRNGRPTVRPKGEALQLARALIFGHSSQPMRLASWTGVLAMLVLVVVRAGKLIGDAIHPERAEPLDALLMFMALGFLVLAIVLLFIAEYVGGIARRMRDRPAYYVSEEQMSAVLLREERTNVVVDAHRSQ
jgi:polyisoprenyl-phosphate glycosyltransferase